MSDHIVTNPRLENLSGQRFDRWLALSLSRRGKSSYHLCRCDCGIEREVISASLKNGKSRSCGCLTRETTIRRSQKHGHAARNGRSREHIAWAAMLARCDDQNGDFYDSYGGRGIYICQRWREAFANFLADLGKKPTPNHSLDRINNNGNYTCGRCDDCIAKGQSMNCRWATPSQQARNKNNTRFIEANGERLCVSDWAERMGISPTVIHQRLWRGWPEDKAATTPLMPPSIHKAITPS